MAPKTSNYRIKPIDAEAIHLFGHHGLIKIASYYDKNFD
jgi:hypothetical protein